MNRARPSLDTLTILPIKGHGAVPEAPAHTSSADAAPIDAIETPPLRQPMTVRLDPDLHERLRVLAFRTRRTKGELIELAIRRLLESQGV